MSADEPKARSLFDWVASQPMYFDREGKPIVGDALDPRGTLAWAKLFEDDAYRRVAEDTVGSFYVSTVWMGHNMNFNLFGPPLIFETMIFDRSDPDGDRYQERYSTEAEALVGHAAAVEHARGQDAVLAEFAGIIAGAIAEARLRE